MHESITVSDLNTYARMLLEQDEVLSQVFVEGEISGLSLHQKSGHLYFSLRDRDASVKAVMFARYAGNVRFVPKDGMQVIACCKVSLYERDGAFQLYVYDLLPKGVGAVHKQLDNLAAKLEAEGLFLAARKRPLPANPRRIGVITSTDSAAYQDILSVTGRRNPTAKIIAYGVNVQGLLAVGSIVRAIERVNMDNCVDVVILARGGGSKDDLWYFNSEELVRAAATLRMPLVSAVGHETDTTLVDAVADARAPTPSAAAELAVPDIAAQYRAAVRSFLFARDQLLRTIAQSVDDLAKKAVLLQNTVQIALRARRKVVETRAALCRSWDPMQVLFRGYAHVTKDAKSIRSIEMLARDDTIAVRFGDGVADCTVNTTRKEPAHGQFDL